MLSGIDVTEKGDRTNHLAGAILGTAVGDALGLPFEGMSRGRVRRSMGLRNLSHGFLGSRGMVSDDTEHTCLVAHAIATANGDVEAFRKTFAWHLRWWLVGVPAGIGLGTLRAIVKLWLGFGATRSGVKSAGNGPAMRAAIIGAYAAHDEALRNRLVSASTRITHTDSRAEQGALAVAHAAALSAQGATGSASDLIRRVRQLLGDCEMAGLLEVAESHAETPTEALADHLGLRGGVSGFVNHTVPIAIHIWARHPSDLRGGLEEVIRLGGDTDTTGAIVGGMVGAGIGRGGIPQPWLDGLLEWPRSVNWMERLAQALAEGSAPPQLRWPATFLRNAVFTMGVYGLICRRALPPY